MLHRAGVPLHIVLSLVSFGLALFYFTAVRRLVTTLRVPTESRLAFGAALALGGTLGCFAGYSESAGVLFVAATWWWAEMLPPLADHRQAARLALAWLAMFLAHRLAVLMLAPLVWRALGPAHAGDTPASRRSLLLFTLAGGVLAAALLVAIVGPSLIVADLRETFQAAAGQTQGPEAPFVGFLNALWLVAPLAFLAAIAGWRGLGEFVRDRTTQPFCCSRARSRCRSCGSDHARGGAGAHRDWDVTVLLGFPLAFAGATLLTRLAAPRLRGALMICCRWSRCSAVPGSRSTRTARGDPPRDRDGHSRRT